MKKLALAVSLIVASACGVEAQQPTDEAAASIAVSAQSQALCTCDKMPPLPATPASPTEFVTYYRLHDGRMLPAGTASAYMVTWQDPKDPSSFISLAYDVTNAKNIFYLHGSFKADFPQLTALVAKETTPIAGTNPLSWIEWGSQGQIRGPPPPDPIGGYPQLAWNAITPSYQAMH